MQLDTSGALAGSDALNTGAGPGDDPAAGNGPHGGAPSHGTPSGAAADGVLDRVWARLPHPALLALITLLVTAPVAWVLPGLLHTNPFTQRGGNLPLAVGAVVLIAVAAFALWRRGPSGEAVSGLAAGLFAAYTVLLFRTALHGTPFAFQGLFGDTGRIAAMATRYTVSWVASDGIVAGRPAEYPPLFPYLIGKWSALSGTPVWRLMQPAEILTVAASVIAGFTLWLRLVRGPVALAIVGLDLTIYGWPSKAYEVLALMVVIPWILSTFLHPPRRRLHWAVAGVIGGLIMLTYYTYLVFAGVGLIVLAWTAWRRGGGRAYLVYLAKVVAITAVISSWFVLPYLWAMMVQGGQQLDVFEAREISQLPFPFLEYSPLAMAQLVGLIGLLGYRRSTWWARPLLILLISAYLYRALNWVRYVATGHTGLFYYTTRLISAILIIACVLAVAEAASRAPARLVPSRQTVAGVLAVVFGFTAYNYWYDWMPAHIWEATYTGPAKPVFGNSNNYAELAHQEFTLDGHRSRYVSWAKGAPGLGYFPNREVIRIVEGTFGKGAQPHVLACDETVFAYSPWRGYLGVDRGSSYGPVRWDDRFAALERLSHVTDPAQFAQASSATEFGPIDVFILRKDHGDYIFRPVRDPRVLHFTPAQFSTAFSVVEGLPADTMVAVRKS